MVGWPQLVISVSNKLEIDCFPVKQTFGGYIRWDKSSNTYEWEIYSEESLSKFATYTQHHPLKSSKTHRAKLSNDFIVLRRLKAYKACPKSETYTVWLLFENEWRR